MKEKKRSICVSHGSKTIIITVHYIRGRNQSRNKCLVFAVRTYNHLWGLINHFNTSGGSYPTGAPMPVLLNYYYRAPGTLFHQIRANPRTKLFERGRRACAPCKSQAFCETSSQHLSRQKPIRSYNIWLLKRILARNYCFRSCVITLRSIIRVRCV